MPDQAEKLRTLVQRMQTSVKPQPQDPAPGAKRPNRKTSRRGHVIAVTSGKGGVGKSSLAVGIGLCLRRLGKSVTLLDMDLGLANLDIMLGISTTHTLADVVARRRRLKEIVVEGPNGIRLVPGSSGVSQLCDLSVENRRRLVDQLQTLEDTSDVIIIDTGAGVSENVLTFCRAADEVVVIATSDPAAIADAYAVAKLLGGRSDHPPIGLVMNMVRTKKDIQRIGRIIPVAKKFHGLNIRILGTIPYDNAVGLSLQSRRPFVNLYPESKASLATMALARTISTGSAPLIGVFRESFFQKALGLIARRQTPKPVKA